MSLFCGPFPSSCQEGIGGRWRAPLCGPIPLILRANSLNFVGQFPPCQEGIGGRWRALLSNSPLVVKRELESLVRPDTRGRHCISDISCCVDLFCCMQLSCCQHVSIPLAATGPPFTCCQMNMEDHILKYTQFLAGQLSPYQERIGVQCGPPLLTNTVCLQHTCTGLTLSAMSLLTVGCTTAFRSTCPAVHHTTHAVPGTSPQAILVHGLALVEFFNPSNHLCQYFCLNPHSHPDS